MQFSTCKFTMSFRWRSVIDQITIGRHVIMGGLEAPTNFFEYRYNN